MKGLTKRKSKRIPTKQRVKAEKKVREHNRKIRKDKKKNPGKYLKMKRKNLSVPNDCPFKEAVLKEVEEARQRKEAEKVARRQKLKEASSLTAGQRMAAQKGGDLQQLMADAHKKADNFQEKMDLDDADIENNATKERSAKSYYKEFAKVVDVADVILQVLDARDPLGTRCRQVEDMVLGHGAGKRMILILNKADLVSKENLNEWMKYLKHQLPCVAFKSSTQSQSRRLGQSTVKMAQMTDSQLSGTSKSVGVSELMDLLANYCRNKDVKTSIRVGVVGYPNVGKSSLINSLKRGKVCHTGNLPGVTKVMQEIQLDSKIVLLDCPGLVLNSSKQVEDDVQVALRNALKVDQLSDYLAPIEAILQRCEKQNLQILYNITDFSNANEFLALVSKESGKIKRGGVPNRQAAAKKILADWNCGKIKYCTHPPKEQAEVMDVKVLAEYSKEFSLDMV